MAWDVGYAAPASFRKTFTRLIGLSPTAYGLGIRALNTRYLQKTTSLAGFGHVEAELMQGLRLVGGARYTR